MPLTPKPTFTQASRPDKSPSSVLSSTLVAVPQLLPTPCLGSPWRVTAPQHPQALEGRSILALPSMQSLLEAGRQRLKYSWQLDPYHLQCSLEKLVKRLVKL